MGEVVEKPLFRDVTHALNWAYRMEYVSSYPSQDLRGSRVGFNAWTDLSALDKHAQAAYIRDITQSTLKAPEVAVIRARHGYGFTQLKGIHGLSEHVRGTVKNDDECLTMIVASVYKKELSIRQVASRFAVTTRSIQDDMLTIKGHIDALEKMAYLTLDAEFRKYAGLIEVMPVVSAVTP